MQEIAYVNVVTPCDPPGSFSYRIEGAIIYYTFANPYNGSHLTGGIHTGYFSRSLTIVGIKK